jgi:hypothetical protein
MIPCRADEQAPRADDTEQHRERAAIEQTIKRLKAWRRVITFRQCEAAIHPTTVTIAMIPKWLQRRRYPQGIGLAVNGLLI